jgi:hypothetical protein
LDRFMGDYPQRIAIWQRLSLRLSNPATPGSCLDTPDTPQFVQNCI